MILKDVETIRDGVGRAFNFFIVFKLGMKSLSYLQTYTSKTLRRVGFN